VRLGLLGVGVVGVLGLAACGSGSSSPTTTTTQHATTTTATPTTTTTAASTTTTAASGAQNLPVTDALRTQLLAVGAALHNLPVSDYTGLEPGVTYYAYDAATKTYWAGFGLAPSSSSMPAQVANQDDGSYQVASMPSGGAWTAQLTGLGGVGGTPCPITPPADVLAAWNWAPGSCRASS
jgi:hypothetical protein